MMQTYCYVMFYGVSLMSYAFLCQNNILIWENLKEKYQNICKDSLNSFSWLSTWICLRKLRIRTSHLSLGVHLRPIKVGDIFKIFFIVATLIDSSCFYYSCVYSRNRLSYCLRNTTTLMLTITSMKFNHHIVRRVEKNQDSELKRKSRKEHTYMGINTTHIIGFNPLTSHTSK